MQISKITYLFTGLFSAFSALAGGPTFSNGGDIFGTRVFIENKSQFDASIPGGSRVLYALENGTERVYLTDKGVVYQFREPEKLSRKEREAMERDPEYTQKQPEKYHVSMEWQGASPDMRVEATGRTDYYFTYGASYLNSHGYRKVTYYNVYDGIDIEYFIPDGGREGIKYNVILHPGAQVSDLQMKYSGAVDRIRINEAGDLEVKVPVDKIIEHAPESFYKDGEKIASTFVLNDGIAGFGFPVGADAGREVVIDPWVTTISSLPTNHHAYDVDYDFGGNTYVYGGYNPYLVAKYSSTGALVWVFSGTITNPSWSSSPSGYAGNFVVQKFNNKVYIGQGFNGTGDQVIRLDPFGNYDNFINTPTTQFKEVWDMGFHCTGDGEVFVLGGGTSSNISAVTINPTTAVMTLATFQPTNNNIAQDVASHAIDDAGVIFVLYAGIQSVNNKMCQVNSTFNGNVWTAPTTFNVMNEAANKTQYVNPPSIPSNGFNALAVNGNYLYYYDGLNLAAYNKANGNLVTATTVSGHLLKRQGGIAVDDCNNIYLGSIGSILGYNFNGTTFSTLTPIQLNTTATAQVVYDIKLDKAGKLLYVCGSGFVGTYQPSHSMACPTASSICFSYQLLDHIICAGRSVTLAPSSSGTLTNASYTLLPDNTVNSTGSFVVSPTITTTYTMYATGMNSSSVVLTHSAVSNVTVHPSPLIAPTSVQSSCTSSLSSFNLNLTFTPTTASPGYTVTWSTVPNGITSPSQLSATAAMNPGVYTATVAAPYGCIAVGSITINPQPASAAFAIVPNGPWMLNCYDPTMTFTFNPTTNNYTTTNGTNNYTTGPNPVFTFTNYNGTYTTTSQHPVSGCVATRTYVIQQTTLTPQAVLTPTFQNITCALSSVTLVTANATPTINVEHTWMSPSGSSLIATGATANFLPGGPGTYTHCVLEKSSGCRTCRSFSVTSNDSFPSYSVVSPDNFTLGCTTKSVATINYINVNTTPVGGPVSYALVQPGSPLPGPGPLPGPSTYTVISPGTYTAITHDNTNGCRTMEYFTVLDNKFGPPLDSMIIPRQILNCDSSKVTLEAISYHPNVGYTWLFPTQPGSQPGSTITVNANMAQPGTTLVANYTISLIDNNNTCRTTSVIPIVQNLYEPKAVITGAASITCVTHTITLSNGSETGIPNGVFPNGGQIVGILWEGPTPQLPVQMVSSYVAAMPGIYTLTVKDKNNGCISTATTFVRDNREHPYVDKGMTPEVFPIDCGQDFTKIYPVITTTGSTYSFSWIAPPNATITGENTGTLSTNTIGEYVVQIMNNSNGCSSQGLLKVIDGTLSAGFMMDNEFGYAPLPVTFTNTSASTTGTSNIISVWNYGNGAVLTTTSAAETPVVVYNQPGTYTITIYATKGPCVDTAYKVVHIEVPSRLEIPNVFTPNGDGTNDLYFLRTASLAWIHMTVYDRWGRVVYDLETEKGNVAWDGKNRTGKDVPDGVYYYKLQATGKDGEEYDLKGNITLTR
jgi:gliding motility-associated-like protein